MWGSLSLVTLGFLVWLGFYAYKHVPYAHSLWIRFSYHAAAARFLRAVALIGVTLLLIGLYRLFGIARRVPPLPEDADVEQLRKVVSGASSRMPGWPCCATSTSCGMMRARPS